jgi:hypothetical protein
MKNLVLPRLFIVLASGAQISIIVQDTLGKAEVKETITGLTLFLDSRLERMG